MRLSCTILLLLATLPVFSQIGLGEIEEQIYSNQAGAKTMVWNDLLPVGNDLLLAGQSSSPGGLGMYLARYEDSGLLLWDTVLSTSANSALGWLVADAQNHRYAVGAEVIGSSDERQIHLIKLDDNNQFVWQTTYRGPDNLSAATTDVQLVGSYLYLCGQQESNSSSQSFVAKFDLNGNLVWERAFAPGLPTFLSRLAVDAAGNVTAVGSADNAQSFLVLQYDSAGTLSWQYPASLSSNLTQYLADVAMDSDGNIYAVGTRESGVFEADIITLKLSPAGVVVWEKMVNNQDQNEGRRIRFAPDGSLYTLGNLSNGALALVVHYDTAGNSLWTESFQVGDQPLVSEAVVDAAGNLLVAVEDFDSIGVVRIDAAGNVDGRKTYGLEVANYVGGAELVNNTLWILGNGNDRREAQLIGLHPESLLETMRETRNGLPLSDARPGALVDNGDDFYRYKWLSAFSDDGDSAVFTTLQYDHENQLKWERSLKYKTVIPSYPFLAADANDNVVGLFQNGRNVEGGQLGLVKYDSSGNQVFLNLLGGTDLLRAGGLVLDPASNIFVAAHNATKREMELSRFDATGALQWTVPYKSPASNAVSIPLHLERTPQGKLVIAAIHRGLSNDNELHLFQYSATGTLEWQADVATQAGNVVTFSGMKILGNGDIIIFGASTILQYAAARFDTQGNRIWLHEGNNPFSGAPISMAVHEVFEETSTFLCFSTNSHVYVQALDNDGAQTKEGEFSISSSGTFYFPRFTFIKDDHWLIICGEHYMPENRPVPFEMSINMLDLDLFESRIDSFTTAQIRASIPTKIYNNDGYFTAYLTGDLSLGQGPRSILIRSFLALIGSIEDDLSQYQLKVFPNPTNNEVFIECDLPGIYRVSLIDLQGRELHSFAPQILQIGGRMELVLPPGVAPGLYLLSVITGEKTAYRRLLVK